MYKYQRTIKNSLEFSGIGLHTGKFTNIKLLPSKENEGIIFKKYTDKNAVNIKADFKNVCETNRGTTIGDGDEKIYTVEHLLAAIYAHGIDNLTIEIDNIEPPILDGSSKEYYEKISDVGIAKLSKKKKIIKIDKPIYYLDSDNDVEISIIPYDGFKISFSVEYNYGNIGKQSYTLNDIKDFYSEISGARTFCSFDELYYLKSNKLIQGASLDRGIVFMNNNVNYSSKIKELFNLEVQYDKTHRTLNGVELRYEDEPVRHKILDLIGDFALFNGQLQGHVISKKSGHFSNIEFLKKIDDEINNKNKNYSFDKKQIKQVIPHREPFLLIDEIVDIIPGKKVIANKKFTDKDYFFKGHFPDNPIVPGVILIECMAQASCFLSLNLIDNRKEKMMLLSNIKSSKFIKKVVTDDIVQLEVDLIKFRLNTALFRGVVKVNKEIVTKAEFMATVVEKNV